MEYDKDPLEQTPVKRTLNHVQAYHLMLEYQQLSKFLPRGVGLYKGGIFKFSVEIPRTFGDASGQSIASPSASTLPRVFFQKFLYHPLINPNTGELLLGDKFPAWDSTKNQLWTLICYAVSIFEKCSSKNLGNVEAYEMARDDNTAFRERVERCVLESRIKVYDKADANRNGFQFSKTTDEHRLLWEEIRLKFGGKKPTTMEEYLST